MLIDTTLSFIGAGTMAEAMISGILNHKLIDPERITASEPRSERIQEMRGRYGIRGIADNCAAARAGKIVVLSVKPQTLPKILPEIREAMDPDDLVISIVAGAPIRIIQDALGVRKIARAMPNTPGQVGMGMTVWTATSAVDETGRRQAQAILSALGKELYVADEGDLDMATALSGTGPAYVFLFMEALIDAGVHMGFSRRIAAGIGVPNHRRLGGNGPRDRPAPYRAAQSCHFARRHHRRGVVPTRERRPAHRNLTRGMGSLSTIESIRRSFRKMNYTLATIINEVFRIFSLLILIDVIGSWVMLMRVKLPDFVYDLLRGVQSITSVVLNPIRRIIPSLGGLDISPIIALLLLDVLRKMLVTILVR